MNQLIQPIRVSLFTILLTAAGCSIQDVGDRKAPTMNMTDTQAELLRNVVTAVESEAMALPRKQASTANVTRLFGEHDQPFINSLTQTQREIYFSDFRSYLIDTVQRNTMSFHRRSGSSAQGPRAGYVPAVPMAGNENQ